MKHTDDKNLERNLEDILPDAEQVGAAYQSLRHEKPPAELDELILRAAREEAGKGSGKAGAKRIPYQAYSIAATICLSILVVSLFLQSGDELTGSAVDATSIPLTDAPVVERLEQQESGRVIEEVVITAERAAANAEEPVADLQATRSRLSLPQQAPQLPDASEDIQAEAFSLSVQQDAADAGAAQAAPDYRASPDSWLAEILRLQVAGAEPQAAEERRLFAEVWPDIDIDAALAELETEN